MKSANLRRLDAERTGKSDHRLSKKLGEDKTPGDRGDCEQESTSQGSEVETAPVISRPKA